MPVAPAAPPGPHPDESCLAGLNALYETGRMADAFAACTGLAAPEHWTAPDARILAGRLLSNWGAPILASRTHQITFRRFPGLPEALYFAALSSARRHGPYEGLLTIERHRDRLTPGCPDRARALLLSLEATLLASFRDFARAHHLAQQARQLVPDDPWLLVDHATLLEREDRYDDALSAARDALQLRPWYRPALEAATRLLQLANRDDEALALLLEANRRLQAPSLRAALVRQLFEAGDFDQAAQWLENFEALAPRAERSLTNWLAGTRADIACRRGRTSEALDCARRSDHPFHQHIAARLEHPPPDGRRVHLPVPFVRQHFMTCAPATLSAIARFWGVEIDHAALAREITYDGTPHHVERHWATTHGWVAREFTVTWDAARTLIDRGIPFTLTTVSTRSAHLQAVVGYDSTLGLLLLRDPYEKNTGEFAAEAFFTAAAPHGPRGMVLVPESRRALLEGIELPECDLHDHYHALCRALDAHDRETARQAADALAAVASDHRITLTARRQLAGYDGALASCLEAVDALRARFPEDANLILARAALLRDLGRSAERLEFLRIEAGKPGSDPQLRKELADEIHDHPRHAGRAHRQARSLLSRLPLASGLLRTLANALWVERAFARAELVYRFAATSGRTEENHWFSYFIACRHTGRAAECLAELRQRVHQLGRSHAQPAITLYRALDTLDRVPEALAVLEEACARLPGDRPLRLYMAREFARHGRREQARHLLETAGSAVHRSDWLRTSAFLAGCGLDHPAALAHWRELLALEPFNREARMETTRLTAVVHGRTAALEHLRTLIAAHPHDVPLRVDLATWCRDEAPDARLAAIDAIIQLAPAHAWAWRERALALRAMGRPVDALLAAERGLEHDPHNASSLGIKADLLLAMHRHDEAHALYRQAIRCDAAADWLIDGLFSSCAPGPARREALEFLVAEVLRQPLAGDIILALPSRAAAFAGADEIMSWLRELHRQRPDTWQTWAALRAHLADTGALDEALAIARTATERFPVLPRAWSELADSEARLGRQAGRIAALHRAVELNPSWTAAWLQLGLAHEAALDLPAAEHAYRRAVAADPLDHLPLGHLGDLLWKRGHHDEAIATLTRAVEVEPDYAWGWRRLQEFHRHRGRPEAILSVALAAARARPGEARGWLTLARLHLANDAIEPALQAATRAVEAEPRHVSAHDWRALILTRAGRFEQAISACMPDVFGNAPPLLLRGRRAWIDAKRNHLEQAVTAMSRLIEEAPDYGFGLECLCEWLGQLKRAAEGVPHARTWTRLAPNHPDAWGWLAWLLLESGQTAEGVAALERTIHLQPDNIWAVYRRFTLHLDDGEPDAAARLLEHLRVHAPPSRHARAVVELACHRGRHAEAIDALGPLLEVPPAQTEDLDGAAGRLLAHGRHDALERWLRPRLSRPSLNTHVGKLWIQCWAGRRGPWMIRHLERSGATEAVRRAAWVAWLSHLGEKRMRLVFVLAHAWRRHWLAGHDATRAEIIYALASFVWPRRLVHFCRDWPQRSGLGPATCFNIAIALLRVGRPHQAAAALDRGLQLPPDHVRGSLASFRALLACLDGDTALAAQLLHEASIGKTYTGAASALTWARALIDLEHAPTAERDTIAQRSYQTIAACRVDCDEPHMARLRQRALRRLGARAPHPQARMRGLLPGTHLLCATRTERRLARLLLIAGTIVGWLLFAT